jgi:hypothetical protein
MSWLLQQGGEPMSKRRFIDDQAVEDNTDLEISDNDDSFDNDGVLIATKPTPAVLVASPAKKLTTPVGHTNEHANQKIGSIKNNPKKAKHIRGEGGKKFVVGNNTANLKISDSDDDFGDYSVLADQPSSPVAFQAHKLVVVTPVRGHAKKHADNKIASMRNNPKQAKNTFKDENINVEGAKKSVVANNMAAKRGPGDSDEAEEEDIAFGILDTNYDPGDYEPHGGVHGLAIKDVKAPDARQDRTGQMKWPHRLFVIVTKDNTLIATLYLPRMEDVGISEYPLRMILKHAQFQEIRKAVKFHKLAPMVSTSNPNIALMNGREKDSGPRNCILRLLHPHRTVSKDMIRSWGENVAKLIERFGSAGRFDSFYNFAGDLTPPVPRELACYITLSEVFKIMEARHQNQTIHQLLNDKTIAELYIPHHLMSDATELAGASHPTNGTDAFLNGLNV